MTPHPENVELEDVPAAPGWGNVTARCPRCGVWWSSPYGPPYDGVPSITVREAWRHLFAFMRRTNCTPPPGGDGLIPEPSGLDIPT